LSFTGDLVMEDSNTVIKNILQVLEDQNVTDTQSFNNAFFNSSYISSDLQNYLIEHPEYIPMLFTAFKKDFNRYVVKQSDGTVTVNMSGAQIKTQQEIKQGLTQPLSEATWKEFGEAVREWTNSRHLIVDEVTGEERYETDPFPPSILSKALAELGVNLSEEALGTVKTIAPAINFVRNFNNTIKEVPEKLKKEAKKKGLPEPTEKEIKEGITTAVGKKYSDLKKFIEWMQREGFIQTLGESVAKSGDHTAFSYQIPCFFTNLLKKIKTQNIDSYRYYPIVNGDGSFNGHWLSIIDSDEKTANKFEHRINFLWSGKEYAEMTLSDRMRM